MSAVNKRRIHTDPFSLFFQPHHDPSWPSNLLYDDHLQRRDMDTTDRISSDYPEEDGFPTAATYSSGQELSPSSFKSGVESSVHLNDPSTDDTREFFDSNKNRIDLHDPTSNLDGTTTTSKSTEDTYSTFDRTQSIYTADTDYESPKTGLFCSLFHPNSSIKKCVNVEGEEEDIDNEEEIWDELVTGAANIQNARDTVLDHVAGHEEGDVYDANRHRSTESDTMNGGSLDQEQGTEIVLQKRDIVDVIVASNPLSPMVQFNLVDLALDTVHEIIALRLDDSITHFQDPRAIVEPEKYRFFSVESQENILSTESISLHGGLNEAYSQSCVMTASRDVDDFTAKSPHVSEAHERFDLNGGVLNHFSTSWNRCPSDEVDHDPQGKDRDKLLEFNHDRLRLHPCPSEEGTSIHSRLLSGNVIDSQISCTKEDLPDNLSTVAEVVIESEVKLPHASSLDGSSLSSSGVKWDNSTDSSHDEIPLHSSDPLPYSHKQRESLNDYTSDGVRPPSALREQDDYHYHELLVPKTPEDENDSNCIRNNVTGSQANALVDANNQQACLQQDERPTNQCNDSAAETCDEGDQMVDKIVLCESMPFTAPYSAPINATERELENSPDQEMSSRQQRNDSTMVTIKNRHAEVNTKQEWTPVGPYGNESVERHRVNKISVKAAIGVNTSLSSSFASTKSMIDSRNTSQSTFNRCTDNPIMTGKVFSTKTNHGTEKELDSVSRRKQAEMAHINKISAKAVIGDSMSSSSSSASRNSVTKSSNSCNEYADSPKPSRSKNMMVTASTENTISTKSSSSSEKEVTLESLSRAKKAELKHVKKIAGDSISSSSSSTSTKSTNRNTLSNTPSRSSQHRSIMARMSTEKAVSLECSLGLTETRERNTEKANKHTPKDFDIKVTTPKPSIKTVSRKSICSQVTTPVYKNNALRGGKTTNTKTSSLIRSSTPPKPQVLIAARNSATPQLSCSKDQQTVVVTESTSLLANDAVGLLNGSSQLFDSELPQSSQFNAMSEDSSNIPCSDVTCDDAPGKNEPIDGRRNGSASITGECQASTDPSCANIDASLPELLFSPPIDAYEQEEVDIVMTEPSLMLKTASSLQLLTSPLSPEFNTSSKTTAKDLSCQPYVDDFSLFDVSDVSEKDDREDDEDDEEEEKERICSCPIERKINGTKNSAHPSAQLNNSLEGQTLDIMLPADPDYNNIRSNRCMNNHLPSHSTPAGYTDLGHSSSQCLHSSSCSERSSTKTSSFPATHIDFHSDALSAARTRRSSLLVNFQTLLQRAKEKCLANCKFDMRDKIELSTTSNSHSPVQYSTDTEPMSTESGTESVSLDLVSTSNTHSLMQYSPKPISTESVNETSSTKKIEDNVSPLEVKEMIKFDPYSYQDPSVTIIVLEENTSESQLNDTLNEEAGVDQLQRMVLGDEDTFCIINNLEDISRVVNTIGALVRGQDMSQSSRNEDSHMHMNINQISQFVAEDKVIDIQRTFRGYRARHHTLVEVGVAKRKKWEEKNKSVLVTMIHSKFRRLARAELRVRASSSNYCSGGGSMLVAIRRVCATMIQRQWRWASWKRNFAQRLLLKCSMRQEGDRHTHSCPSVTLECTEEYISNRRQSSGDVEASWHSRLPSAMNPSNDERCCELHRRNHTHSPINQRANINTTGRFELVSYTASKIHTPKKLYSEFSSSRTGSIVIVVDDRFEIDETGYDDNSDYRSISISSHGSNSLTESSI